MEKSLANSRPVATTIAQQYVELVKAAFDQWERKIEGEPTWGAVDKLMCAILLAIDPEGCHHD